MCLNYPGVCKEAYVKECKAIVFLASGFKRKVITLRIGITTINKITDLLSF